MAQIVPVYEAEEEINEIVKALIEKYNDLFFEVDPSSIRGYVLVNKPRPDSKPAEVTINGASGVFAFINPFKYVLVAYASDWSTWSRSKKVINVAKAIKRISPEGNGKLIRFDEMNHRCFLLTFGIGYEENPEMVDILQEKVDFVF
jgi:hypothetical protein